ncbi:MAG: threonylcarbamoyl-AMP synthase [Candidatus Yanofskybacteria bacterium RIFCSPHIGHO2_01_FULL_44_22]|uniref:L-threonylcarbamoyladenylate synthase n=1 Tax=Candidatus Yanofskybacteria bacterium RIFCSPHIGHO2_01_FULL_44_22 TaxID=1802669 RepID=A0A1F8EY79_9BACT|nr:MAG: Translation factor SUA5 [Parcubacteria group bacterium GW2011_GWA1_47_9]OGN05825.1 MAG: threonylcarbamoyl-AMP synthase [Candidatus Yanofskybacteria bacterium RIFCSPHIGHO2_01_FULL_44_22]
MQIIRIDLNKDYSTAIAEAVAVLSSGGTIVYPTDTLYGLGANALDEEAVKKIYRIKNRSFSKPLPVIVKNMLWAKELAYIGASAENILEKIWPMVGSGNNDGAFTVGKVTVVLPKKEIVPSILTSGQRTIGIRIPDFIFLNKLLGRFGYPLTSTSVNISGEEPSNDINKIITLFEERDEKPDLIIDAGVLPKSEPSTILDLTHPRQPKILRVGPSKPDQLLRLLQI